MQGTLQRLPDGLQTMVGESGFGLSVGERQRIQIARVIVSRPPILVMDEATANLDYATEAEVKKTIDEIRKTATVIMIAHRYSMVKDADRVIVLDSGQIREEGSPADLIAQGGWFASFAHATDEEEATEDEEVEEEESEDEFDEEEE
jgi:ABC-type multidrug transport system fused ATPase/permease subunit